MFRYLSFLRWAKQTYPTDVQNDTIPEASFIPWLKVWLDGPGLPFKRDVVFNDAKTKILSSRVNAFTEDIIDGSYSIRLVDSVRASATAAAPSFQVIASPCLS